MVGIWMGVVRVVALPLLLVLSSRDGSASKYQMLLALENMFMFDLHRCWQSGILYGIDTDPLYFRAGTGCAAQE